ncbi:MAG: lipid-A-disaccharide synthase [Bacteroidota bacterium]|nr:lipid-A-disaccharide synthase [Bacteroidota bacterium]
MKYYIIAGEASGDLHASNLMKALKVEDSDANFRYFGGDLMQAQGGVLVKHYKDAAFMGFLMVLKNIGTIRKNFQLCEQDLLEYQPDVLILVDYPGFNLRMAEFAKKHNIKVYYYISPKIWAWKQSRIKKIKAFVDEMFCILPFEVDFYKRMNYRVHYVGNPCLDAIEARTCKGESIETFCERNHLSNKPIVALVPGSRKSEIQHNLPIMAKVSEHFPEYQFVITGAPSMDMHVYKEALGNHDIPLIFGQTYETLQQSAAALVTSGTATLETALLNVPQVVCFKAEAGRIGYLIVHDLLLKTPWVSLVNLTVDREVVKEILQHYMTEESVREELDRILSNEEYREKMLEGYVELHRRIGTPGASEKAARLITELLSLTD